MRRDPGAASAKDLGSARIRTDYRNGFGFLKRQEVLIVFQEDNRFTRGFTNNDTMFRLIFTTFWLKLGVIKRTSLFKYAQQPTGFVIQRVYAEAPLSRAFWTISFAIQRGGPGISRSSPPAGTLSS